MADKNIQMTQRNAANTAWDNLYPITKVDNIGGASAILNAIKTVGGAGSGLDADLLDGKHASDFMIGAKAYGNITYTDQIAGSGTLTKTIALGGEYNHGLATVMKLPLSPNSDTTGILTFFGKTNTNTKATGFTLRNTVFGSSWSRRAIGSVTHSTYGVGSGASGNGNITIEELYISGSNLTITFKNEGTSAISLNCVIDWEVW